MADIAVLQCVAWAGEWATYAALARALSCTQAGTTPLDRYLTDTLVIRYFIDGEQNASIVSAGLHLRFLWVLFVHLLHVLTMSIICCS